MGVVNDCGGEKGAEGEKGEKGKDYKRGSLGGERPFCVFHTKWPPTTITTRREKKNASKNRVAQKHSKKKSW